MEERLTLFLHTYGKKLLWGMLFVAMAVFAGVRFFSSPTSDYLAAKVQLEKMKQEGGSGEKLKELMAKNPHLADMMSGAVAREFAVEGNWEEAEPFGKKALQNLEKDSPYFAFAENTWLIAQKAYPQALANAESLESQIEKENNLKVLRAYNLIRLISLKHALGIHEKEAIDKWQQFEKENQDVAGMMNAAFQEGNCCLNDFLAARKIALAKILTY